MKIIVISLMFRSLNYKKCLFSPLSPLVNIRIAALPSKRTLFRCTRDSLLKTSLQTLLFLILI